MREQIVRSGFGNRPSFVSFHAARVILFFVIVLGCSAASIFAQIPSTATWRALDSAKSSFEKGELGEALALCEKARNGHRVEMERMKDVLSEALSPSEVRRSGEDISQVREILLSRNELAAIEIIDSVRANPVASLKAKTTTDVILWLEKRSVLPEADMLSGYVFEAEGEYTVASDHFRRAWEQRAFLDIPDDRFTILYALADIAQKTGDLGAKERYLLAVLSEDPIYGKPGAESPSLKAMIRTLETEQTTDKFFTLYRHRAFFALPAYQKLSYFYYLDSRGRLDSALPVSVLAAIISVTALNEAVSRYEFSYAFSSFSDLLDRCGAHPEIVEWATRTGLWESFLTFARILDARGNVKLARSLRNDMALHCPDEVAAQKASGEAQAASPR